MADDSDFKINMRLDRWTWALFGRYTGWRHRTAVIAEFIDWYTGLSDDCPERPTLEDLVTDRDPTKGYFVGTFDPNDDNSIPTVRTAPVARAIQQDDDHIRTSKSGKQAKKGSK